MELTQELYDEFIRQLFAEGKTNLIIGPRGSGKTTLAVYLIRDLLNKGYYVLSNVIMKRCTGITENGRRLYEAGQAYPDRYTKVRTFAELFMHIGSILAKDRLAKIVWVNDEAAVSFGAYQSVFQKHQRALIDFMTLARKFNVSVLMISVAAQLVHSKLRSVDTGFLGATLRKDVYALRRWGADAMREYGQKPVFIVEWPELQTTPDDVLVLVADGVPTLSLCKPQDLADVGDIVFDSKASATFTIGTYPGTSKPFNIGGMLTYISDCTSEEVPGKINEFLTANGEVEGVSPEGGGSGSLEEMDESTYLRPGSVELKRAMFAELDRQLKHDPPVSDETTNSIATRLRPAIREALLARGNIHPDTSYPGMHTLEEAVKARRYKFGDTLEGLI